MTVTYPGSKTQWDAITKGSNNDVLENQARLQPSWKLLLQRTAQRLLNPRPLTAAKSLRNPLNLSKENHTFAGWYNGDEKEKFDFDADTTNAPNVLKLVAKWDINQYTVQFVSEHGSFEDQTIEHGKPIGTGKPTIPEVEGYTFVGWYADEIPAP